MNITEPSWLKDHRLAPAMAALDWNANFPFAWREFMVSTTGEMKDTQFRLRSTTLSMVLPGASPSKLHAYMVMVCREAQHSFLAKAFKAFESTKL